MEVVRRWSLTIGLILVAGTSAFIGVYGLNGLFATSIMTHIVMTMMGLGLEIGKLSVIVHLHAEWHRTDWMMRSLYIGVAVIIMALTSFEVLSLLTKHQILSTAAGVSPTLSVAKVFGFDQTKMTGVLSVVVTCVIEPLSLGLTYGVCSVWGKKSTKRKPRKTRVKVAGKKKNGIPEIKIASDSKFKSQIDKIHNKSGK